MVTPDISLANKIQLLFGAAVVVILAVALGVPWVRLDSLVYDNQLEIARRTTDVWLDSGPASPDARYMIEHETSQTTLTFLGIDEITPDNPPENRFAADALAHFRKAPDATEFTAGVQREDVPVFQYARPIQQSELATLGISESWPSFDSETANPDRIAGILVLESDSRLAQGRLLLNHVYIVAIGLLASLVAMLVFYFLLTKLILYPVRRLRETAERIETGDATIRADIKTGDEFEQLSEAFNTMLDRVQQSQSQLLALNETLDLKVTELSETNVGLYDSNRLKSEFLANVSHELRTPLNSIIGFAELLEELARGDSEVDSKRQRYLANILASSRSLLEMINELLEMAKIEAGRIELAIEPTSVADLIEGLQTIMRPQAEAKNVHLETRLGNNLPTVETDPGKLQQILYNFLSNAVKFSPPDGVVTIAAERITRQGGEQGVRLSVTDHGPGIADDMQDVIFEKFRQIDASHTREHTGTGLGLSICRELAQMLGASVSLVSEAGKGATFYVNLPVVREAEQLPPLMPQEG